MIKIYVLKEQDNSYQKKYYVLIDPNKIESITISDERTSNHEFHMWVININLPHYSYRLIEENTSKYYWASYDKAFEYLKKIGLHI